MAGDNSPKKKEKYSRMSEMEKSFKFSILILFFCFITGCKHNAFVQGSLKLKPDESFQDLGSNMAMDISDFCFTVSFSGTPGTDASLKDYVVFSSLKDSDTEAQEVIRQIQYFIDEENLTIGIDTRSVKVKNPVFLEMKISDDFEEKVFTTVISAPDRNGQKKYTAVISDVHLTDERADQYGYALLKGNKTKLLSYLSFLKENAGSYKELVLLGDIVDEMTTAIKNPGVTAEKIRLFEKADGTEISQFEYEQLIAAYNEEIISAIKEVGNAGVQLVYLPGNHDQYVTPESITSIFGENIKQVRSEANPYIGSYSPESFSNVIMEHGHRYDVINAPDPYSNEGMTKKAGEEATLSIGYFLTRAIAQIRIPRVSKLITLLTGLTGSSPDQAEITEKMYAIENSVSDPDERNSQLFKTLIKLYIGNTSKETITKVISEIDTGIGGISGIYSVIDLLPKMKEGDEDGKYFLDLTKQDTWEKRLRYNQVPEDLPFIKGILCTITDSGMVDIVKHVYGNDSKHNIFIMGHTHRPGMYVCKAEGSDESFIYANSGSWVRDTGSREDGSAFPQCTFIELYENNGLQQISLKCIDKDMEIKNVSFPLWYY